MSASFLLQLAIHHEPNLARVFGASPLPLFQCAAQIALGAVPRAVLELRKLIARRAVGPWSRSEREVSTP